MSSARLLTVLVACCLSSAASFTSAAELNVVATVPDLGDLVKQLGGERVRVTTLVRSGENPHYLSARPSFVHAVAQADAVVSVGLDLEVGWLPALLQGARNRAVAPGTAGYIDCSAAITPLQVATTTLDRSLGDVHPHGNPHYLLSPVATLQVIGYLAQRLEKLDPAGTATYQQQAAAVRHELAVALYGEAVVEAHAIDDLIVWHERGRDFLLQQLTAEPGGWLAELAPIAKVQVIDDHDQWPYLAGCFDFTVAAHLEPAPGIPPSSAHLQKLVSLAKKNQVAGIITSVWFHPRHARLLAESADLPVVPLAHQVGARRNTDSVLAMHAANVAALATLAPVEPATP